MLTGLLHTHLGATVLVIILFLVVFALYRSHNGATKNATIVHMILRVFLVVMLFSGLGIYIVAMDYIASLDNGHMIYGLKALFGILTIALVETTLVSAKKRRKVVNVMFVILLLSLLTTLFLGAYLEMGTLNIF